MTRLFRLAAVAACGLMLASCALITLAPAGPYKVGKGASTTLDRDWADVSLLMPGQPKTVRLLSVDGPLLNRLYLSDGLIDGQPFVRPVRSREATTPVYRSGMGFTEQVEFIADSVTALGYERVATTAVRPVEVSGLRGVRFEITAFTKEGLEIKGIGQGVVKNDALYVAVYLAPGEHYFAVTRSNAEAAMNGLVL